MQTIVIVTPNSKKYETCYKYGALQVDQPAKRCTGCTCNNYWVCMDQNQRCLDCAANMIKNAAATWKKYRREAAALVISKAMEKYWYDDLDEEGLSRFCKFSVSQQ